MRASTQLSVKKYLFVVLILFSGLWFVKIQQSDSQPMVGLTDADSGKILNIAKGHVFRLTLPDHINGGYRFDTIQYDHAVVALRRYYASPPPANSAPGHSGTGTWQFIAIKKGNTVIKVTATRPWKGGGTVTIFKNKVLVK